MHKIIFYFFCLLLLSSCTKRNLAYFSDLEGHDVYTENVQKVSSPKIKPDDVLEIIVSSLNPEANSLFNMGTMPNVANANAGSYSATNQMGYLVDHEGYIEYPVLGRIQLGGLTKEEAKQVLQEKISAFLKDPIINIRFQNYRITVIGEVNRPSTFIMPSEKTSVLTALGMAGDMTNYGKRDNVLIIREEDGIRTMTRINLNEKDVLNSPYFYLQQNDIVYVEPVKSRGPEYGNNLRIISIVVSIASVVSLLLIRLN